MINYSGWFCVIKIKFKKGFAAHICEMNRSLCFVDFRDAFTMNHFNCLMLKLFRRDSDGLAESLKASESHFCNCEADEIAAKDVNKLIYLKGLYSATQVQLRCA